MTTKKSLIGLLLAALCLSAAGQASAADPLDREIEAIEADLNQNGPGSTRYIGPIAYNTPNRGLYKLIPDISVITTFAGAYFTEDPTGATGHDPARTGFTLQEIEVAFQSYIDPYFRADIFLAFTEFGVELEEGYATTIGLVRGLQVRAGKMLLPFGRQNVKHLESWSFADNMLVNKLLLGAEGLAEIGVEVAYTFPTPFFWQIQGTFTNGDNGTSFGGTRKQDFLYQGRTAVSFDLTDELTLLLGGSLAYGFNDTAPGNRTNMYGGDLYLRWKPSSSLGVAWQSEYIFRRKDFPGITRDDGGFYSYVDVQFAKRWHAGIRLDQMGFPSSQFQRQTRITPALTFNPSEYSRLRLQYEWDKERFQSAEQAVILQLEFSMGPHGAHPF